MKDYEKLTNQPLVITLAEFRFSTVLQMDSHVSLFQDYLRQDFPLFSTTQQQEVTVGPQGISVNSTDGWIFTSSNKKRAVMLDNNRIVILTSEYNRYPEFWNDCQKALEFLVEKVKPALLLRIGLRYSDTIIATNEEEPIESYVQPVVCEHGHFSNFNNQIHRINETVFTTDAGVLAIRSLYGNLNLPVWQDLVESPVLISKPTSHSRRILLDFDHYWQPQNDAQSFDLNFIASKMDNLHKTTREAFFEITTENGREVWK